MAKRYKYYRQLDYMDCGPTCLKMAAAYYGKEYSLEYLRANSYITRQGVSLLGISDAAEKIGFKTLKAKLSYKQLVEDAPLPCILHWNQEHFVVLYDVKKSYLKYLPKRQAASERLLIADPGHALVSVDKETFMKCWAGTADGRGIALLLEPTPEFHQLSEENQERASGFKFLFEYLTPYRKYVMQLLLGMCLGSIISLIFPFLTQSLIDYGIYRNNLNFIHLILLSQLLLFVGNITVDLIRNWILLHISTRVSVTIISNFLVKLMKLPINFFESKNIGDITQRIQDHHRIETFLTGTSLNTLFSVINLVIFSAVLGYYSPWLLLIFAVGSTISILWIVIFLRQRKDLDYRRFQRMRENQNNVYELITGMQEIKLNNCEKARRWEWERIQAKLFKINIKSLALEQYQEVGSSFVTQLKNILISYFAATLVIQNQITLGVMLSISYIIGQMNGPLSQLMNFIRSIQDAKISLDRLGEVHNKPDEELNEEHSLGRSLASFGPAPVPAEGAYYDDEAIRSQYQVERGIRLQHVSFRYGGPNSAYVLKNLSLNIPEGKVTAIVGTSGSGKSTLLKLLLKFYAPNEGEIRINGNNLQDLSAKEWRKACGTVMQDGYIFSDTIARNIAVDGSAIDEARLLESVRVANLQEYLRKIPLGFTTKIGNAGSGLSGGQRQRIFIARSVYKNPTYIFFDEATSALDANNERIIMDNLDAFFQGKTVVVIAHRLSTVKNADQIVVLENGEIKEVGNHQQLVEAKGPYFELVKNQLELAEG
ncbi:peptidase domain-containing ABC transporter [Rhabdobacter roseus]|uniref:ATP-binding cassette subfamily B protein n=1 Tax=Rhabdobacter roseus TaxID=1655419 RepID=A0A840U4D1_9BACT|nr:peptidase domain-containing ABC transporter [Rhabdobacter roseus]MBB5287188.1 ATP-binding cassette subfamily B protein [Rhabdobacter roseus]